MKHLKNWLCRSFLPDWCREELLAENELLAAEAGRLRQENRELTACIAGMEAVLKRMPKAVILPVPGREAAG